METKERARRAGKTGRPGRRRTKRRGRRAVLTAQRSIFPVAPFTTLLCAVVIHPTTEAMHREYSRLENESPSGTMAFCHYNPKPPDNIIASLHFCLPELRYSIIAHEAFHAVLLLGRHLHMDIESGSGEELLAIATTHITQKVVELCDTHRLPISREPPPEVAVGAARKYTVTAYCPCTLCCGEHADGITASGKKAVEGVTAAATRSLPFGTRLKIEGVGVRVVQDRLAAKYDHRVDLFFKSHQAALQFGKRTLAVEILD